MHARADRQEHGQPVKKTSISTVNNVSALQNAACCAGNGQSHCNGLFRCRCAPDQKLHDSAVLWRSSQLDAQAQADDNVIMPTHF